MAAYSGLWDGIHGEPYPSQTLAPHPPISGVLRVMLQKRGLWGMVRGFGRNAPATVTQVETDRADMENVRGSFDYDAWKLDKYDPEAAQNRDMTITNLGDGEVNVLEDNPAPAVPADADETDMLRTADTHRNREYAGDDAASGATAVPLPEVRESV